MSVKEAEDLGFKIVIFPLTALYAATKAMMECLKILKETGNPRRYLDKLITFHDFNKIIGLDKIRELEQTYLTAEELALRYGKKGVKSE